MPVLGRLRGGGRAPLLAKPVREVVGAFDEMAHRVPGVRCVSDGVWGAGAAQKKLPRRSPERPDEAACVASVVGIGVPVGAGDGEWGAAQGAGFRRFSEAGPPEARYRMSPPSTLSTVPVMNEASGEARKTYALAMSSG